MENKIYTLVTHNARFHADDIFACATLQLILDSENKKYSVVRTRDPEIIKNGDFVFDIGGIHDPSLYRFDHHQKGGAGTRDNGIPYAACGLVWKTYGEILTGNSKLSSDVDFKLFQPIDADDNAFPISTVTGDVSPYKIQNMLYAFRTTWKEDESTMDTTFLDLVALAKKVITREIKHAQDTHDARSLVLETYNNATDKRLIIFDVNMPAEDTLMDFPEPLFAVRPNTDGKWRVTGVASKPNSFERRKDLPESWAGLRDEDLQKVTGVSDAVFCHNGRFLAVAGSREGAIKLAQMALDL